MEKERVSYTDACEKRVQNTVPACVLLRKNFWNGVLAHSVTKIPLLTSSTHVFPKIFVLLLEWYNCTGINLVLIYLNEMELH
jgi:hypothetical protein